MSYINVSHPFGGLRSKTFISMDGVVAPMRPFTRDTCASMHIVCKSNVWNIACPDVFVILLNK